MAINIFSEPDKNAKEDRDAIEAFLANGGAITVVPDEKKLKKIRRAKAASERAAKKAGHQTLFDLGEF